MNVRLVQSIKLHLAEQASDELRKMLEERDASQYSDEAFAAAREVLEERARGESREPPPKPAPPPKPTPAQLAAVEDALLKRQIRAIGIYYYGLAAVCASLAGVFVPLGSIDGYAGAVTAAVLALSFCVLGWSLRRFSRTARLVALIISMVQWPAFPIGTVIGLYCFDKLTRGGHLFGAPPHPGERET